MKARVKIKTLPKNDLGRDIVVGDLHGSPHILYALLDHLSFDEGKDRVICTGDTLDRGPDTLGMLEYLAKPWFFSVRGNHEDFLHHFCKSLAENVSIGRGADEFFFSNRKALVSMSSEWLWDLMTSQRLPLDFIRELIEFTSLDNFPHILMIDGEKPFVVSHACIPLEYPSITAVMGAHHLSTIEAERFIQTVLWTPQNSFIASRKHEPLSAFFKTFEYDPGFGFTFHGHTVLPEALHCSGRAFIDTGCGFSPNPQRNPSLSAVIWQERRVLEVDMLGRVFEL